MQYFKLISLVFLCYSSVAVRAQDTALDSKVEKWITALQLPPAKAVVVKAAVIKHLSAVRDWHNDHAYTLVPEGINPANGNKLSTLDREVIICSAKPASIHAELMQTLRQQLDSNQVNQILDDYTIGKVAFTLKGYQAIVPDLTPQEEQAILTQLRLAREQAIDYKSMKEISAIFEIYKTKCEQYLNNNGRNWRQLFKAYVDKVKAEKAANKNQ